MSAESHDIDDILDEALEDDESSFESVPRRSKGRLHSPSRSAVSPTASAVSWEFQTPSYPVSSRGERRGQDHDFKTPLVEGVEQSPQGELPQVEGEEGGALFHTVSFYRRQKPNVNVTPHQKIVRNEKMTVTEESEQMVSF